MTRVAFCIGDYPEPERKLRADVALSYATRDVEVGIIPVRASPYNGLGPAEIQLVAPYYHEAFLRAQDEGYDAVVPLGMLDLGVDGGRSLVDIPVIGPCEAAFHIAAQLGQRFGIVCYSSRTVPRQITQTRHYGMEEWIAGRRAVELELKDMTAHLDQLVDSFLREARSLIKQDGADLIIAHGISLCPVHIKPDFLVKELGVPVVEGIGAPIRMAALLADLGLKHSRIRWPKSKARPQLS